MSLTLQLKKQLEPMVSWEDITCILWHNDMLFTTVTSNYRSSTGCNGKVNVWDKNLNSLGEFQAHDYGIYHMCSGPDDTIYTCASDSTICHWQCPSKSFESSTEYNDNIFKRISLMKGHMEPPWKLQFFNNKLFSADELGEIRVWENDCFKGVLETYEEIWDMIVIPRLIFTVRNLDVTLTTIPDGDDLKKACSIKNTIPGRGPLFIARSNIFCLHRTNFDILVYSIQKDGNPLIKALKGHAMLVNALAGNEDVLFSGDYEGKIIAWDLQELKQFTEVHLKENGCVNAMVYEPVEDAIYIAQENKCLTKLMFAKNHKKT